MKKSFVSVLGLLLFSTSSFAAALLATEKSGMIPVSAPGASPEKIDRMNEIQALASRPAAPRAAAAPEETLEPGWGAYQARVALSASGAIQSTTVTDLGANVTKVEYAYNGTRLTQLKETLAGCEGSACFEYQKIQGFALDSKGRFALMWKVDTGMPTLNYNYWYDVSNPGVRYFRARVASTGAEYGTGRESFDAQGRVTSYVFTQTSSDTSYSFYDQAYGIHQAPTTGKGFVTRKTFTYSASGGKSYVQENTWLNAAMANPPDDEKTYRIVRGVRLLERHVQNGYASGNRAAPASRYVIGYSYPI